ncbi:MAG: SpoIIE family protein phosphatase, partial [Vallitaleaceae bacterium]|nr:SpoIIE family protein phosphatase [Vallitaleaceae bacterium]
MSRAIGTVERRIDAVKVGSIARSIIICLIGFMMGRGIIEGFSPMLVAYYCVVFHNKKIRMWNLLAIVLGMATISSITNIFKYLSILVVISVVMPILETFYRQKINAIAISIGGIVTILVGLGYFMFFESYKVGVVGTLLEGCAVLLITILMRKGVQFLMEDAYREGVSKETYISFAVIACFATMGTLGIQVLEISLLQLVALNILLYVGFQLGLEAASILGIAIGFGAFYTKAQGALEAFMIWSVLGVVAGLFRELGKIGTAFSYSLVFVTLTYVLIPGGLTVETIEMLIITVGLFLLLPIQKRQKVYENKVIQESEIERMIHHKLERFADTYENIAKRFIQMKPLQERLSNHEINQLIDHVAEKVCADCSMCNMCWQKDFYETYKAVYSVLSAVENKGEVMVEDIPEEFYKQCLKLDEFVIMVNRIFEMYKNNLKWENKIIEHRALFADQFLNVSQIIKTLSGKILDHNEEHIHLVKKLKKEWEKNHLDVLSVHMQRASNERKEIIVEVKENKDQNFIKELIKVLNKMSLGKFQVKETNYLSEEGIKQYLFAEKENFKLVKGYAKSNKEAQEVSGDSFTFLDLESGKDIIALSDGMGSGEKALVESKATIEMLEQLVEGGFDIHVAIKTVNTILGIRNDNQTFATLDVSMVDRFTGECQFIKNGA